MYTFSSLALFVLNSGKSAALSITFAKWDWFKEWKDEKVGHRGDRYEGIKDAIGRQMWHQIVDLYPQLEGKKVYMEVGTPVTNQHYLGCPNGEMCGLDQHKGRFSPEVVSKLRTDTDINGLYLTGQDSLACGFISAVFSGVMCASKILNRNINTDLAKLLNDIAETNRSSPKKTQ
ncbi:hypothetical protein BsWGS_08420 [Bradybaena similaris]